jgi:hypothetical protein
MGGNSQDVRGAEQLAEALLRDVEQTAERSVARMQELLPSYGKVPAEKLIPVTLTNTRKLLEGVRDPGADPTRAEDHFRAVPSPLESAPASRSSGDGPRYTWLVRAAH